MTTRFALKSCALLVALSVAGCSGSPVTSAMQDASMHDDASDGGALDANRLPPSLLPTVTNEGAWTIEQFESVTLDAVELASDESGNFAIATTNGASVSVLTPQDGGYSRRIIESARGPLSLAIDGDRIVVKYRGLNNAVTLSELERETVQTATVDSRIGLRALSTTSVAFSANDGLLVLADTLDLGSNQRAITTYRADASWQAVLLSSFLPPSSTEPVAIELEPMSGGIAALTDNEGTLTFYDDALSSESSVVATLQAAASLCVQAGDPRVIAADAHGTGFADRLRVFDRSDDGAWVATELESARAYSETRCAATTNEMVIVDAASTAPLLVRGSEVRRLASFGDLRARPRVIAIDETIHLVWANGNQELMHATANAAEL